MKAKVLSEAAFNMFSDIKVRTGGTADIYSVEEAKEILREFPKAFSIKFFKIDELED